ncbi:MAG: phosphopentomutase [Desulfuromonadales bacterium]
MTTRSWRRIVLLILDGVGVGALPDADCYGDADANTLRHVAEACGGLTLPNLQRLGLGNILPLAGVAPVGRPAAHFGRMRELSAGKDTVAGHWEIAGVITAKPFATFPTGFPVEIIDAFQRATGLAPLGNIAASGTAILRQLGEEHLRSGRPIVYTSADSVFQIAAHESIIPPERLYELCRIARDLLKPWRILRVIARPFTGANAADFRRTAGRHDFSLPPTGPTVLDAMQSAGLDVIGIGKIHDIFAGRGLTRSVFTAGNAEGMEQTLAALSAVERGLIFTNLVDFDMLYGHRQDAAGFAQALARFDAWLPRIMRQMTAGDLLLITADHGCDPSTPGTDHTREYVPLLAWSPTSKGGRNLGIRGSFADIGATVAAAFSLSTSAGRSFLVRLNEGSGITSGAG